jgi:outer membrane receptor protein involved in Fe transport
LVDNLSRQAGGHAWRAGIDVLYNDDTITFPRSIRGSYTFSTLQNFLSARTGMPVYADVWRRDRVADDPNVGVYAQDEWTAGPGLTINGGVRYDLQFLQTIATDANNVSRGWVRLVPIRFAADGDSGGAGCF